MADTLSKEEALFHAALEIEGAEQRSAYLDAACGNDEGLRRRVVALLRRSDEAQGPLDRPVFRLEVNPPRVHADQPGSAIGPYKLMEAIGEGGMGLVFVAEQQQPVRRKVALKLIKPGMDSKQVIARFEAERQALALMDHAHIAKVFDAGTTEAGRPYFVMELVRGVPITDYCDRHRLDIRQRLGLFVQVCQAVQHAHMKGIIHRDLKPSNILVAHDDTVAVPKIIDFGIAKATTQPLTERTLYTALAQVVGTPLYMSPEQAALHQNDVDTRSDVYSLGVLLYELLTGTTPFAAETLKRVGLDEVRRMIREEEPPAPSARISTLGAAKLTTLSERRCMDERRLRQILRGELDWVVMRCLEKDRERRYETASALAADVQRYLDDEPVAACPPSAGYRLRKYVRRNRRLLITAGLFVAVLVAASAVSTWQAVVARDAQRQAEAAKEQAATEAAIARAVNDFLQGDLLQQAAHAPQSRQEVGVGPYLTVKEALDRASAHIGQRFHNQPLVEAAIRSTIGSAYNDLHDYPPALFHLERAVALRQAHLGTDHQDTIASTQALATANLWMGRHQEAIALFQHTLESRKRVLGPGHPETLERIRDLGVAYQFAGQLEKSRRLLEQLLPEQKTVCGPAHPATLGTMHQLAMTYGIMDRLEESLVLHNKLLAFRQSASGPTHEDTVWCMLTYAQVCQKAGKLDEAQALLHEAVKQIRRRGDSLSQREQTANARGWLARNLLLQKRYTDAEPLMRETVATFEELQPNTPRRFYWVSLLGAVLLGQRKYEEAEPLLLQGYQGMKQREPIIHAGEKHRLSEMGEYLVRFYEVTKQADKARAWRQKLSSAPGSERSSTAPP